MQKIDSPNETRVEGAKARQEKYVDYMSKTSGALDKQNGPGVDGTTGDGAVTLSKTAGGYVGGVSELERNDDTRHPTSKIWVRRDRKPDDYLHTGNG